MTIERLSGTLQNFKCTRGHASFVLTDDDRNAMGIIAIAAGLSGLSGQAISTAANASDTDEEADYLEFELNGKPVKGWVWRSPFKEGETVDVVAEWQKDHYELFAVARPADRTIALYPHCSRGVIPHWLNAAKWWFLGTTALIIAFLLFGFTINIFSGEEKPAEFIQEITAVYIIIYCVFGLMTVSMGWKWLRYVRISERVFTALGWKTPKAIDLVKSSKKTLTAKDPVEVGIFYFRY